MRFTPEDYAKMSVGEQTAISEWLREASGDQELNICVIECKTPYLGRIGHYVITTGTITTEWFDWETTSPFPYFLEEGHGG